jgi:hypothetical protein
MKEEGGAIAKTLKSKEDSGKLYGGCCKWWKHVILRTLMWIRYYY